MMTLKTGNLNIKYIGTVLATDKESMYNKTIRYSYETTDKGLVLSFELAGKTKDDVKIKYANTGLNIKIDNKDTYAVYFDKYADVDNYNVNETKASMKNGLLTVTIPKKKEREYDIQVE
jgi:HSP20 family molecular chaperone IbpA